jgi:hypothetical protein
VPDEAGVAQAAFETLCLTPAAPIELVSAARRYWARQHHPDAGGETREMVKYNNAADLVEQWLERQRRQRAEQGRSTRP